MTKIVMKKKSRKTRWKVQQNERNSMTLSSPIFWPLVNVIVFYAPSKSRSGVLIVYMPFNSVLSVLYNDKNLMTLLWIYEVHKCEE